MKDLLQGKPLGHPLHPMLVHLPIGLLLLSFVFDVIGKIAGPGDTSRAFVRPAFYTMLFGVVAALLAAVPGLADYSSIRRDHPARRTATWHMLLNVTVVAIYVVNLALRRGRLDDVSVRVLPFVLSLIAVGMLSFSGYLGGILVYDDGIGVGRHRRRTPPPKQTIVTDGTLAEADVREGETLRLDINDTIVCLAKVDGQLYAFQEFCTHRFGPLSEGTFVDGANVKCPWHGSCFDMKTGKVTEGPAKEEIRVFPIEVRDGQVRIVVTDGV